MKADELKYLSDESLEKLDKDGYVWGASVVGAYVKEIDRLQKYVVLLEEIRNYTLKGLIISYKIKCPNCGEEYEVSVREYNFNMKINCMKCNHEYAQCDNIINYKILDREAADKQLGYK